MEAAAELDTGCGVFGRIGGLELDPQAIHRFVVGEDERPRQMGAEEAAQELGDPFATLLLLQGEFPKTAEEVLEKLRAKVGEGDPLAAERTFVLGEGTQLAESEAAENVEKSVRFVVSTGFDKEGPDVLISAFHPESQNAELMAWDRQSGGFNYYRAVDGAWVFAGNSRHALSEPTEGKGPFQSHPSGAILMKELEIPWINWHSFEAPMSPTVFPQDSPLRTHRWFTDKEGADVFELGVAIPSMERWARARFEGIAANGGTVENPRRIMKQVLATPTVNLVTSKSEGRTPGNDGIDLPPSFFFSSTALTSPQIGLAAAPTFQVPTELYAASVEKFDFRLADERGFEQEGDTKFAFLVPERAREDDVVIEAALRFGLLTPRFVAALLMVDFANPIFSNRRESLLAHMPLETTIAEGASTFSEQAADAIVAAADGTAQGSAEREFAERWAVGDDFAAPFSRLLQPYFEGITQRLATQEGFDDFVRLAESRRRRMAEDMEAIVESSLLFPKTNIPNAERAMRPDGSVAEIGG